MGQKEIGFIVTGPDAESGANEIKEIINQELEYDSPILTGKEMGHLERTRGVDPIALGALLLSIPGAILAVIDLAGRIEKKQKLDNVLEKINQQVVQTKKLTVKISYPNGMIKEISSAESSEILDYFTGKE